MNSQIETLKTQINNLFEKVNDKETITELTQISDTIKLIEADVDKQSTELTDIMRDYKDLVKHTSFKVSAPVDEITPKAAPSLEQIISQTLKK